MPNLLLEDGGDLLLEDGGLLLLEDGVIPPITPVFTDVGGIYFWRPPIERLEISGNAALLAPAATHECEARVIAPVRAHGMLAAPAALHEGEARNVPPIRGALALMAPAPEQAGRTRVPRGRTERELLELLLR